jgi:SAM-dependent methyltransferase
MDNRAVERLIAILQNWRARPGADFDHRHHPYRRAIETSSVRARALTVPPYQTDTMAIDSRGGVTTQPSPDETASVGRTVGAADLRRPLWAIYSESTGSSGTYVEGQTGEVDGDHQRHPSYTDHLDGAAVRHGASSEHRSAPCDYDAELRLHTEVLRRVCDVQRHDHVLDIGCGTGQTTRAAARMAQAGDALGIDISVPAIERARERARSEGLHNVTFERADAQTHRFPQQHFDLAISRFGTMFFDDPVAAFANVARALRPDGRLVMMVWQAHERNEWDVALHRSLEGLERPVAAASAGPDPFSLADPPTVEGVLEAAGFVRVRFTDVREPVYYGPDVPAALDWVRGFTYTNEVLKRLDPGAAVRALGRLREALAAHMSDDGVGFDSRAWIVTARRH